MNRGHREPINIDEHADHGPFDLDYGGELNSDPNQFSQPMRTAVVHHVVTAFLVAMVLAVGTWTYLTFRSSDVFERDGADGRLTLKAPLFAVPAADAQLRRFQFALDVFFKLNERYPPSLDALVEAGLLEPSDLNYPPDKASRFVYERVGDSYRLTLVRTTVTTTVLDPAEP